MATPETQPQSQQTPEAQQTAETPVTPEAGAQSLPTSLSRSDIGPFDLPPVPDLPSCNVCKTGLLYVIANDPDALHENQPRTREGSPTDHAHFIASGGAIRLMCFNCGMTQTQPTNPDPQQVEQALVAQSDAQRVEQVQSGVR